MQSILLVFDMYTILDTLYIILEITKHESLTQKMYTKKEHKKLMHGHIHSGYLT